MWQPNNQPVSEDEEDDSDMYDYNFLVDYHFNFSDEVDDIEYYDEQALMKRARDICTLHNS